MKTKPIENVWRLVKDITSDPKYVEIDSSAIDRNLEHNLEHLDKVKFSIVDPPKTIFGTYQLTKRDRHESIIDFELIANSVNYCYWYGLSHIRPLDCCATKMYKLLEESYKPRLEYNGLRIEKITEEFGNKMILERFPLIQQRLSHLREISSYTGDYASDIYNNSNDLESCLNMILLKFPGYAQDMFLKRASLFFMQVYRQSFLFCEQINMLPIPADYQIPKMLEYMGILNYSNKLKNMINNGEIIPSGSIMECEIRASAIEACRMLGERSQKDPSTIDNWLWLNRKSCKNNFHLTITTDY